MRIVLDLEPRTAKRVHQFLGREEAKLVNLAHASNRAALLDLVVEQQKAA
jgi:hypothetical protein